MYVFKKEKKKSKLYSGCKKMYAIYNTTENLFREHWGNQIGIQLKNEDHCFLGKSNC